MTNTSRLRPAALLLAMLAVFMAVPACATLTAAEKALPTITADVNEVVLIVSTVETFTDSYFANHPNPTTQATVSQAFTRVKLAASAVQSLARAGADWQGGQGSAALAELSDAYTAMVSLVRTFGVTTASSALGVQKMAAAPGRLIVPPARDLRIMALQPTKAP